MDNDEYAIPLTSLSSHLVALYFKIKYILTELRRREATG
jgi:hypothetical protein